MRPLLLTIEGINSFTDAQTLDFTRVGADNIFCISGCTGSGKTTVLDCIILALYQNHSERGNLSDYINLKSDSGRITFRFELNGEIYESVRVLSRKQGKNSMLLSRGGQPVAEGEAAFAVIQDAVGLEVKEFTNVVVLQQGEFARFLKAKKADRVALINKLFDLKRFEGLQSKFNAKAKEAEGQSVLLNKMLEGYADVSKAALDALSAECAAAEETKRQLEKVAAELADQANRAAEQAKEYKRQLEIKSKIAAAEKELADQNKRLEKGAECKRQLDAREEALALREKGRDGLVVRRQELKAVAEESAELDKKEAELKSLSVEAEEKRRAADAAGKLVSDSEAELAACNGEMESALSAAGLGGIGASEDVKSVCVKKTAECTSVIDNFAKAEAEAERSRRSLEEAEETHRKLLEEWERTAPADKELQNTAEKLDSEAKKAALYYEDAARLNALALVKSGLKEGDECPVCGGKIDRLEAAESEELDSLKEERDKAYAAAEKAKKDAERSGKVLAALTERINSARTDAERKRAEYKEKAEYCAGFDKIGAEKSLESLKKLAELTDKRERLEVGLKDKQHDFTLKKQASDDCAERLKQYEADLKSRREKLAEKAGENPRKEAERLEKEIGDLDAEREKFSKDKKGYDDAVRDINAKLSEINGSLRELKSGLKDCPAVTEAEAAEKKNASDKKSKELNEANGALGTLAEKKERLNKDLAERIKIEKEKAEADKRHDRYSLFVKLFNKNAFSEFVAAEYIKDFTAAASERLCALTSGKYSMEYDEESGEFFVRDFLSGNERRGVKTLSGGETFLASLSLAIAISEELSKNKNFDFFFIDEGFGTLSPDALDTVMSALEALSRDTLVGVITHRGELIERIPSVVRILPATADEGSKIF